jgi:hypothetical protein
MTSPRDIDRAASPPAEHRMIGSLRDALAAADVPSRRDPGDAAATPPPLPPEAEAAMPTRAETGVSAAEAARQARGTDKGRAERLALALGELSEPASRKATARVSSAMPPERTQLLRGRNKAKPAEFFQDPVVGWLVVIGGLGLGAFRPIFEGNNTVGRASSQRIPIDFGDETISNQEQAYIRYDSADRKFLLVPNLAKTNIVAVNEKKPTGAVELAPMDVITMGRTQLVFVPFCGEEFDWAELAEMKG